MDFSCKETSFSPQRKLQTNNILGQFIALGSLDDVFSHFRRIRDFNILLSHLQQEGRLDAFDKSILGAVHKSRDRLH